MLTLRQTAVFLNVSEEWVEKQVNNRQFPYVRFEAKTFIPKEFLARYKTNRKKESNEMLDLLVAEAQELDMGY